MAEREKEYGVPYGADAVIADMDYINSDKYAKKFDSITDNAAVNEEDKILDEMRKRIEKIKAAQDEKKRKAV